MIHPADDRNDLIPSGYRPCNTEPLFIHDAEVWLVEPV